MNQVLVKDFYMLRIHMKESKIINKRESKGLKYLNDSEPFIKYSNDMNDILKNIKEWKPNKK